MASDVKFNIKLTIDGKEHIVDASTDVKKFAKELSIAQKESNHFRDDIVRWSSISATFQNLSSSIQQITGVTNELVAANNIQVEAETKLATVMRQRMGATDDEIDSIKALASEQQKLGIIGDEVQLSGAQQIATFVSEKSSLEMLLPAMNNLLAQQKGLNATSQDAVSIGNLMGKVMQGQTSALTRAGITFTDAQAQVLKFGTETERAAMLAKVITDNVGEMNAELAKTDAGKAKQMANHLGDIKEQFGAFVSKYQTSITVISQGVTAFASLGSVVSGFGGALLACQKAFKSVSLKVKDLTNNLKTLTTASRAASVAIKGLAVATGVGVAITAIAIAVERFNKAQERLEEGTGAVQSAQQKAGEQYDEQAARIKTLTGYIHNENIATDQRRRYIDELRSIIPDYNASISEEGLITKENTKAVNDYLVSLERKIKLQAAEDELTDIYKRQRDAQKRLTQAQEELTTAREIDASASTQMGGGVTGTSGVGMMSGSRVAVASAAVKKAEAEIKGLEKDIEGLNKEITGILDTPLTFAPQVSDTGLKSPVGATSGSKSSNATWKEDARTLKEVTDNIKILNDRLHTGIASSPDSSGGFICP